nr:unnamed protein product [Callosobruchus chinensis]
MTVMRNCIGKPDGENVSISNITSLVNIETFPNSYKLMQIALTLPISSSSCERSFSAMRRIKNWLRSSMGQNRFSYLALANIEGEAAKSLKAADILDAFIKTGNRLKPWWLCRIRRRPEVKAKIWQRLIPEVRQSSRSGGMMILHVFLGHLNIRYMILRFILMRRETKVLAKRHEVLLDLRSCSEVLYGCKVVKIDHSFSDGWHDNVVLELRNVLQL